MQDYSTTMWHGVTKSLQENKTFQIDNFLVKYTNYKAIQPLCGMKLRRFYKKEISVGTCIAHEATLI